MKIAGKSLLVSALLACLAGCASHPAAPVVERTQPKPAPAEKPVQAEAEANFYVVQKGDTLLKIAAANKLAVRDLAAWNNIENPNKVEVGQRLRVVPPGEGTKTAVAGEPVAEVRPVVTSSKIESRPVSQDKSPPAPVPGPKSPNTETFKVEPQAGKLAYSPQALAQLQAANGETPKPETPPVVEPKNLPPPAGIDVAAAAGNLKWIWPIKGKLVKTFDGGASMGVDIQVKSGEVAVATSPGKVLFAGNYPKYGKLVIVKHNKDFLSAYANGTQILVAQDQMVKAGQKIVKLGDGGQGEAVLHFEIRRQGNPVDPMKYLPNKE